MTTKFRFKNADNTTVDFEDYYVRADYFRSGNLWVMGENTYGKLGDNTLVNKSSPVQTIACGSNWKQVDCGQQHTAAIKTDGTLWTWGYNLYGQIGDNTATNRSSPVQTIAYGTNWMQVACGNYHTAAIKTDGTCWAWGTNTRGQLGSDAFEPASPVQTISFGNNWKQISCGDSFTAAIKTDGTLWCWGYNQNGQLGNNTITHRSSPVQTIAYGTNWKQVSCGLAHTAAIKTDGTLWSWGRNYEGQLGDNTITHRSSPVQTTAYGTNWKQVSCNNRSLTSVAIKTDGTLWGWGSNGNGVLGDNTMTMRSSPIQTVAFGTNWKKVSCGSGSTAAIKTDGTLWTWGYNFYGQLGNNTVTSRSSPIQTITGGTNWMQVAGGYGLTAAIQYQDDYQ